MKLKISDFPKTIYHGADYISNGSFLIPVKSYEIESLLNDPKVKNKCIGIHNLTDTYEDRLKSLLPKEPMIEFNRTNTLEEGKILLRAYKDRFGNEVFFNNRYLEIIETPYVLIGDIYTFMFGMAIICAYALNPTQERTDFILNMHRTHDFMEDVKEIYNES